MSTSNKILNLIECNIRNYMKQFCILLIFSFCQFSCEDIDEGIAANKESWLLIGFLNSLSQFGRYDPACDNESLSTPLTLSSPVLSTSVEKTYRFTTGLSGLKYNFSVSSDYPTCGVLVDIRSCRTPYTFAGDVISCNSGSYRNYLSGGIQTCQIPSFSNQVILVYLVSATSYYPTTPCTTVQFEVIP